MTKTTKSRIYFPKRGKQRKLAKIKRMDRDRRAFKRAAYGKPIAKVSERQKERLKEYAKVKAAFLKEHSTCELAYTSIGRCDEQTCKASDVHHVRSRIGKLLTDTRYFLPVCRFHHTWLHNNVAQATKMGYFGPWGKQTP